MDRFASRDRGWQEAGSGMGSSSSSDGEATVETETAPTRKVVRFTIVVSQSGSQGWYAKLRRWARLTFRR